MGGVKDKIMSLFKNNSTKDYSQPARVENVYDCGNKPRKLKIKKKKSEDKISKSIRNLFTLKKENEAIQDRIIKDIKKLFEQEEDYCKPVKEGKFYSNNYFEYESNGYRNKTLSIKEYLDEIKSYLKDIINNLKKSET